MNPANLARCGHLRSTVPGCFQRKPIVADLIRTILRRWGRPLPIVSSRGRERSLRWLPASEDLWRDPDEWPCWADRAGRRGVGYSRGLDSLAGFPPAAWRRHLRPGSALSSCRRRWGRGVDGRQYVAVSTGYGRFLDPTPELRPSSGNNLFVFAPP